MFLPNMPATEEFGGNFGWYRPEAATEEFGRNI
jgi:hypothetical protein